MAVRAGMGPRAISVVERTEEKPTYRSSLRASASATVALCNRTLSRGSSRSTL